MDQGIYSAAATVKTLKKTNLRAAGGMFMSGRAKYIILFTANNTVFWIDRRSYYLKRTVNSKQRTATN